MNKISHIINCAGREISNEASADINGKGKPAPVGLKYLTFYWLDDDRQLIFDE